MKKMYALVAVVAAFAMVGCCGNAPKTEAAAEPCQGCCEQAAVEVVEAAPAAEAAPAEVAPEAAPAQ